MCAKGGHARVELSGKLPGIWAHKGKYSGYSIHLILHQFRDTENVLFYWENMDFSPNSIFFPSLLRLAAQSRSEIEFLRSRLISSVSCVFPSLNTCFQNFRLKLKNIQNVKTVLSNCKYLTKPRFFLEWETFSEVVPPLAFQSGPDHFFMYPWIDSVNRRRPIIRVGQ